MAGVGFMGPTCCCVDDCTIASDDFNRADSSTVDGWTEVTSGWEIAGNALKPPTGGLDDIIRFDTPDPGTADGVRWSTTFATENVPGEIKWLVDFSDQSNHHFAELVSSAADQVTLRLWRRQGGTNTELAELVVNGFNWAVSHTIRVCFGQQSITPLCSEGTITWYWTLDLNGPGLHGWQPRIGTGECLEPYCNVTQPPVTGTEVEGDTTTTGCHLPPEFGNEGEPINGISMNLDGTHGIAAVTPPLGGSYVGLSINNAPSDFRFDNAVLGLLQDGCPDCQAPAPCETLCIDGIAPRFLKIVVEGVTTDPDSPSCETCSDYNGTEILTGAGAIEYFDPCEFNKYPACAWSGTRLIHACVDMDCTFALFLYKKDSGEWFLTARPACHRVIGLEDDYGVWTASLGMLDELEDCFELFANEIVLALQCVASGGALGLPCIFAGSTVRVSLP